MGIEQPRTEKEPSPLENIAIDIVNDISDGRASIEQDLRLSDGALQSSGKSYVESLDASLMGLNTELVGALNQTNRLLGKIEVFEQYLPGFEALGAPRRIQELVDKASIEKASLETIRAGIVSKLEKIMKTPAKEGIIGNAELDNK